MDIGGDGVGEGWVGVKEKEVVEDVVVGEVDGKGVEDGMVEEGGGGRKGVVG